MPLNMTSKSMARFSSDCSKLAMSTPDGRLTVWGSGGGGGACDLLHQFSPSSHLTAVSTCLAWSGPSHPTQKKKKRMSMDPQSDLVAMGTSAGTVLVYSSMQGRSGHHLQDREFHQDHLLGVDQDRQPALAMQLQRTAQSPSPSPSSVWWTPSSTLRTWCTPWH